MNVTLFVKLGLSFMQWDFSYMCLFLLSRPCLNLVAPLDPFGFPSGPCPYWARKSRQSCLPPPQHQVTHCAQDVITSFPSSGAPLGHSCSISSGVQCRQGLQEQPLSLLVSLSVSCAVAESPGLTHQDQSQAPGLPLFWLAQFLGHGFYSYLLMLFLVQLFSFALETEHCFEPQLAARALALHQIAARPSLEVFSLPGTRNVLMCTNLLMLLLFYLVSGLSRSLEMLSVDETCRPLPALGFVPCT